MKVHPKYGKNFVGAFTPSKFKLENVGIDVWRRCAGNGNNLMRQKFDLYPIK
jgi:hypothetical protein